MDETLDARIRRESGSAPDADLGGFTIGIRNIMMSRRVILAANGSNKTEIVHKALYGPVTTEVPASVLQLHPFAEAILDPDAAEKLPAEG
jgi:glucosamine-6-phosphate deaminase